MLGCMGAEADQQIGEVRAELATMSRLVHQQGAELREGLVEVRGALKEIAGLVEEQGVKFRGVLSDVLGVVGDLPAEMVERRREMIALRTDLHDYRALDERLRNVESAIKVR